MNNEIINLVKKLNGSIISNIEDNDSILLNDKFMFLKGNQKKYYYILDYILEPIKNEEFVSNDELKEIDDEESVSSEILNKIENDIVYNELIKQIPANLIYSIIILKVDEINDELYKTLIKIEENEYFSKKYVFYYTEEELKLFNLWKNKCGKNSFYDLLNQKDNAKLLENRKNSIGLKFMLRLLIKLPFIKINIENSHIDDFDEELNSVIKKIESEKERQDIEKISEQIFEFIDERENIQKAIEDYFELCKGV